MNVLIVFWGAGLFYIILIFSMNNYFKTKKAYPEKLFKSDRDIMIMSAAGAVIACSGLFFGTDSNSPHRIILFYILMLFMAAAAITDIKKRIIPNKIVMWLCIIWAVYSGVYFIVDVEGGITALVSSAAGFIFSLLVFGVGYALMKNKLGGGDVKLTLAMGLILTGDAIFGALIYALGLSILFAAGALVTKKMTIKDCMPFAPFLFIGTAAAIAVM